MKNNIFKKIKSKLKLINLIKITPLITIFFVLIASIFIATGSANIDSSLKGGTVYRISQEYFLNKNTISQEQTYIESVADGKTKVNGKVYKKDIHKYNFKYSSELNINSSGNVNNYTLVINTNITDKSIKNDIKFWLLKINNQTYFRDAVEAYSINTFNSNKTIIDLVIAIFASIGFIIIYIIFRLDWAQFISIVVSSLFALALTIGIIVTFYIPISLSMLPVFASIWGFMVALSTIVMSKTKQNKKYFNLDDYEEFFDNEHNHKIKNRDLKYEFNFKFKHYYKKKYIQKIKENPTLSKRKIKKLLKIEFKNNILNEYKLKYVIAKAKKEDPNIDISKIKKDFIAKTKENKIKQKENKKEIKRNNRKFHDYREKNNFLHKIALLTIKDLLKSFIYLIIITLSVLIPLSIFSGLEYNFYLAVIIGIIVSIYCSFIVSIPLWTSLERYRALNKVRIHKYLDARRVEVDEQIVVGVNDIK